MTYQIILLLIAIVALYYGAEFTLESAEKIGLHFGLSPLVIGLLIIGFGTSLPEFFVSQLACLRGNSPIAIGNIVGSNIANLFLIMGLTGIFVNLRMSGKEIKDQLILHLILTGLLCFALYGNSYSPVKALALGIFFFTYLYLTFKKMKNTLAPQDDDYEAPKFLDFVLIIIGFGLLYSGGELLVFSGGNLARELGVSSFVISVVLVAFGTSFPELVTSLLACKKNKEKDLIVGNLIGSNIFNVAFVLASLAPYKIVYTDRFYLEMISLVFAALFLLMLSYRKMNFGRAAGIIFTALYAINVYFWAFS